jgi:hypothetical protein
MPNPNPYQARLARALKAPPGELEDTRQRTWGVLCLAYDRLGQSQDSEGQRRWAMVFMQIAGVYTKLLDATLIQDRLTAVEQRLHVVGKKGAA